MSGAVETVTIGDCTLYRADCREILPTLGNGSVDCVVTDPPYGHNNNNGDLIHRWEAALGHGEAGEKRPIANDGAEANELVRWSFSEMARLLRPGCCCCCCCGGGGGPDPQFARWSLWLDGLVGFKQMLVWDKGPIGMGWHYRRSYETVLIGERPGAACNWNAETDDIENIIRPGDYGIRKIIPKETDHPTPKPVELAEHLIRLHTKPGELVVDPFMGRGWVAEACVRLGRRFIGVEIDGEHFAPACKRIEKAYEKKSNPLFGDVAPKRQQLGLCLTGAEK